MLSLSWVAPASSCTLQLASAALSAPAFSCDPTATPGSPCSVQTTLLVRVPPRWLQPGYILRQLLDSWETHSLAIKYTPSVGCPAVGLPPCHQPGKRLFSLETPNATCQATPKTLTQRSSGCTKMDLVNCCNSASIPAEHETVSSPCWHLCFVYMGLLEHLPSFTLHEGRSSSLSFPPQQEGEGKIKCFLASVL